MYESVEASPTQTGVLTEKLATGLGLTITFWVKEVLHPGEPGAVDGTDKVKVTAYVPGAA